MRGKINTTATGTGIWWCIIMETSSILLAPLWVENMEYALLALCKRNPAVTGGFPSQRSSNAEHWYFLCYPEKKMLIKQLNCHTATWIVSLNGWRKLRMNTWCLVAISMTRSKTYIRWSHYRLIFMIRISVLVIKMISWYWNSQSEDVSASGDDEHKIIVFFIFLHISLSKCKWAVTPLPQCRYVSFVLLHWTDIPLVMRMHLALISDIVFQ